jgi:hypothetical protein
MGQREDSEPVVRNLTQERYAGMTDYGANQGGQQKPGGMLGVVVMAGVLVMGVAGVLLFGPDKAVSAVMGLVASSKAPSQEAPAEEPVIIPPKPARFASSHRQRESVVAVARLRAPAAALPAVAAIPVAAPPRRPRPVRVRPGTPRNELLELFGTPDMKATSMEAGHLVENYSYLNPSQAQQVIVLEDGRVVATDAN